MVKEKDTTAKKEATKEVHLKKGAPLILCWRAYDEWDASDKSLTYDQFVDVKIIESGKQIAAKFAEKAKEETGEKKKRNTMIFFHKDENSNKCAILSMSADSDFVTNSGVFINKGSLLVKEILEKNLTIDDLKRSHMDHLYYLLGILKENIVFDHCELFNTDNNHLYVYMHNKAGANACQKLAAVTLKEKNDEVGRKICEHVFSSSPKYVSLSSISNDEIASQVSKFKEEAMKKVNNEKEAEEIANKRLEMFLKSVTLEEQIMEDDNTKVSDFLKKNNCEVIELIKY